jgi:hypothetical protein
MAGTEIATMKPALMAGGRMQAIVPQSMEEAYRLAKAIVEARMAPKGIDSPEQIMIIIMRGLEVGMTPFQALDKIALVNGRPTIWGDGAVGLVRASGLCDYLKEWIEGENDNRVAICRTHRTGEESDITRRFSVADAKRAGLWGKQGPWTQYPDRMLQMRARAFALRDGFADVLGGLYLKEELETPSNRMPPNPNINPETGEIHDTGGAVSSPAPPQAAPSDRIGRFPENAADGGADGVIAGHSSAPAKSDDSLQHPPPENNGEEAPIRWAREQGGVAFRSGVQRTSPPGAYRKREYEQELQAWREGWDDEYKKSLTMAAD